MSKKWMSSTYLRQPVSSVDREERVINGVSVVTAGEALGHGVHLDNEFVQDVVDAGNALKMGLKARFGHPNMCSEALGTYIGRFRNFRASDDGTQAFADLHLSPVADSGPQGELGTYLIEMAEKEADMFGTSIVFTPGRNYRRRDDGSKAYVHIRETMYEVEVWYTDEDGEIIDDDPSTMSEELYVEMHTLHACDAVDEPAANPGGLFAADAYGDGELAANVTEFLDLNPGVFDIIAEHPDALQEFMTRYEAYRNPKGKASMANQDNPVAIEPEVTPETLNAEPDVQEQNAEQLEALEQEPTEAEPVPAQSAPEVSELQRAVADFGAEIATDAFAAGEGYDGARERHFAALQAENETLREKLAAASKVPEGDKPVEYSEGSDKPAGLPWRRKAQS